MNLFIKITRAPTILLILLGVLAFIFYVFAQIYAGFLGIQLYFGTIIALIALLFALRKRFTFILTIGSFFGAMNVWGWHWFFAALFAAPTLMLMIPGLVASILMRARGVKIVGISSKWKWK